MALIFEVKHRAGIFAAITLVINIVCLVFQRFSRLSPAHLWCHWIYHSGTIDMVGTESAVDPMHERDAII